MESAVSASRATGTKSATPLPRECCGWLQNIPALQRGITTVRAKILRLSSSTEVLSLRRCWIVGCDCRHCGERADAQENGLSVLEEVAKLFGKACGQQGEPENQGGRDFSIIEKSEEKL